jgi:hypothetical protein
LEKRPIHLIANGSLFSSSSSSSFSSFPYYNYAAGLPADPRAL